MKVIISAAGTGGHINPGIAIANKIKKEDLGLSKNKKFGVCDYKDNIVLPFIFDEIEINADKKVIGKINSKLYYN